MASNQSREAIYFQGDVGAFRPDFTPSGAALVLGELVDLGGDMVGVCTDPEGIADGTLGSLDANNGNVYKIAKDNVDTFTSGDLVSWDDTNNQAEPDGGPNETFKVGVCIQDAIAADDFVLTAINRNR